MNYQKYRKNKINVGFIFEDSRFGGPHKLSIQIVEGLKKKFNFKILLNDNNSRIFEKKLKSKNIYFQKKKLNFLSKNFIYIIKYLLFFFSDILKIISFINSNNIKIIHVPGGTYFFKTVIAALLINKKILWHIHDAKSNFFLKLILSFLSRYVSHAIFASNKSLKYYKNFISHNTKTKIVVSGTKKKNFLPETKKNWILTVSNLSPDKDILTILKAAKFINKFDRKIKFIICGEIWNTQYNYYNKISEFIRDNHLKNVFFTKKFVDADKYFKKSKLYICSSKHESSPMSVWEAMSYGLPILSTPCGDIPIFMKKKKFGNLFYYGDYIALKNNIINIFKNKNERKKMSKNSKIICDKFLLFEKEINSIKNIYEDIGK